MYGADWAHVELVPAHKARSGRTDGPWDVRSRFRVVLSKYYREKKTGEGGSRMELGGKVRLRGGEREKKRYVCRCEDERERWRKELVRQRREPEPSAGPNP